jgi:hypothetical protein
MNLIVSKWVFEDPLWTLFGSLLSSKGFSGQIQSIFFPKLHAILQVCKVLVLWCLLWLYQQPLHVSQAY